MLGLWSGHVEGVKASPDRQNEWRQAAADFTLPLVPFRDRVIKCVNDAGEDDDLFVIEVEPSDRVHTNKKDEVYLRVGDENRRLTFTQRQELLFDKGQASFEAAPLRGASLDHLHQVLLAIDRKDNLTIGAVLLFSEQPQQWFPEANVRILRYRGYSLRRPKKQSSASCPPAGRWRPRADSSESASSRETPGWKVWSTQ